MFHILGKVSKLVVMLFLHVSVLIVVLSILGQCGRNRSWLNYPRIYNLQVAVIIRINGVRKTSLKREILRTIERSGSSNIMCLWTTQVGC